MKEYWGEYECPIRSEPDDRSAPPYHAQRRAHRIFCTIFVAGIYGLVLTFNWPYIWEFLACLGTAILYAWAVNANVPPLSDTSS